MTLTQQDTFSGVLSDSRCECCDDNCPYSSNDHTNGQCGNRASMILYRIDMEDITGTAFCDSCGEDAMESGLYTDSTDNDDEDAEVL